MDSSTIEFTPSNAVQTTSLVAYQSRGHCLVIGPLDKALDVAERLETAGKTVLVPVSGKNINKRATENGITVVEADALLLNGYLGAFDCAVGDPDSPGSLAKLAGVSLLGGFDLVLDLGETPLIQTEVLPFGYMAPSNNDAALNAAITELEQLEGDFEKPKYFEYDASICAHSRSSVKACSRCIDVCGTGAIKSDGDGIKIEPYLCQGCGSCATNCPSGAVRYAYPAPADALSQLTELLKSCQSGTVLYLHDAEAGAERIDLIRDDLADAVLPLAVEEVASVGMDFWLASVAYGVASILIDAPDKDSGAGRALAAQSDTANSILQGLGLGSRVHLLANADAATINLQAENNYPTIPIATFKAFNDKRQVIRAATDHLAEHSPPPQPSIKLTDQSPFGEVAVNQSACTLCLACVTVCPARALQDGETVPQLKFIESQCLQCGLCEKACPESAISLTPRYLYDSEMARKPAILNEEEPFNCVVCNTPFATHRIIDRMQTKLADHWMFENKKALRRLKMCEDCRVKDMFADSQSGIDVHR